MSSKEYLQKFVEERKTLRENFAELSSKNLDSTDVWGEGQHYNVSTRFITINRTIFRAFEKEGFYLWAIHLMNGQISLTFGREKI